MTKRSLRAGALVIATAAATVLANAAQAQTATLPAASFSGGIRYFPFTENFGTTNANSAIHSDTLGTVGATADLASQKVSAYGNSTAIGAGLIANARLKYYFVLLAGTPGSVHVLIDTSTTASGYGSYFAESEVDLNAKDGSLNAVLAYSHACNAVGFCNPNANHYLGGGNLPYLIQANKIYGITLLVDGHTTNADSGFSAFADPIIKLDPAFAAPSGATFSFSPNLPVIAAPEPASWAMMLVGFGGLGAMTRSRRRMAAPAPTTIRES